MTNIANLIISHKSLNAWASLLIRLIFFFWYLDVRRLGKMAPHDLGKEKNVDIKISSLL